VIGKFFVGAGQASVREVFVYHPVTKIEDLLNEFAIILLVNGFLE